MMSTNGHFYHFRVILNLFHMFLIFTKKNQNNYEFCFPNQNQIIACKNLTLFDIICMICTKIMSRYLFCLTIQIAYFWVVSMLLEKDVPYLSWSETINKMPNLPKLNFQ